MSIPKVVPTPAPTDQPADSSANNDPHGQALADDPTKGEPMGRPTSDRHRGETEPT